MAKLGEEQVMVAEGMVRKGTSTRQVARQLGVTEGELRYVLRKRNAGPQVDGRSRQASGTDGFEEGPRRSWSGRRAAASGRGRSTSCSHETTASREATGRWSVIFVGASGWHRCVRCAGWRRRRACRRSTTGSRR